MYLSHLYWETGLKDTTTIEREPKFEFAPLLADT